MTGLSMFHMNLIRYVGILDLLTGLNTAVTPFGWLFSHVGMGFVISYMVTKDLKLNLDLDPGAPHMLCQHPNL